MIIFTKKIEGKNIGLYDTTYKHHAFALAFRTFIVKINKVHKSELKCVITIFSYVLWCNRVLKVRVRGCSELNTDTLV